MNILINAVFKHCINIGRRLFHFSLPNAVYIGGRRLKEEIRCFLGIAMQKYCTVNYWMPKIFIKSFKATVICIVIYSVILNNIYDLITFSTVIKFTKRQRISFVLVSVLFLLCHRAPKEPEVKRSGLAMRYNETVHCVRSHSL